MNELIFWKEDFEEGGQAKGGYFYRDELKDFLKKIIDKGEEPVGIIVDMDSYNLEIITRIKE